jgi:5-amino-6-(5-phosphoribosylamino)uracil reductase
MAQPDAGTELTPLHAGDAVDESTLSGLYAYPDDLRTCWVRSNFITSLDGGATADGKSGGLAGPGDRTLFSLMRTLCDVVVVGAGTVRTENYSGAQLTVAQRQARQARGQAEMPPIAVVTQSGRLDRNLKLFTRTEVPPLILTCTAAAAQTRELLAGVADVEDCSGEDPSAIDVSAMLAMLAARGLLRVLTEGGPSLHGSFIEADLLDELCLTIAPVLAGGQARRIATGPGQVLTRMRCTQLLTDEAGYLYSRYVRNA